MSATQAITVAEPRGLRRFLLAAFLAFLAIAYLLQLFSPLRINTDSYRLLSMAVSAHDGHGYLVDGNVDQFPLAYPAVVKTLMECGLASSMTLVILNLLCLVAGLWVLVQWCKTETSCLPAIWPAAFTLSSWVMIKHVTLPLTDLPYFGASSLSLYFAWLFYRRAGNGKWKYFAAALVLAYLALHCRSVGLTIFPALALTAAFHRDHASLLLRLAKDRRFWLATLGAAALLAVLGIAVIRGTEWGRSQFAAHGSYFQSFSNAVNGQGVLNLLLQDIRYRLLEFGEIFINLPNGRAPRLLPLFYCVGVAAWLVIARGAWLLIRSRDFLPLALYFLTYAALIFIWPYYDSRFWLPLLPVMAVMLFATLRDMERRWPVTRFASRGYLAVFFLLGIAALLFSARVSLSGKNFSEVYGDGTAKMTYRFAFQNGMPVDRSKVSDTQVRLLRIFEPLARTNQTQGNGEEETNASK